MDRSNIQNLYNRNVQRDLLEFITLRESHPGEDLEIGGLLLLSFTTTNLRKTPTTETRDARVIELLSVHKRRKCGFVRVLELGRRVIGTYSLMRPHTEENLSWRKDTAYLRCLAIDPEFHGSGLSGKLLRDAVDLAQGMGVAGITLDVFAEAHGVGRLYEKFGFVRDPEGDSSKQGNHLLGYYLKLKPKSTGDSIEVNDDERYYNRGRQELV